MKKKIYLLAIILFIIGLSLGFYFGSKDNESKSNHEEITIDLITMVEHNSDLKNMLIKSIEKAKEINPDKSTNPVQTLEEYYDYIDWAYKAMPWKILPNVEDNYPYLFDQIDQGLDYFYFLNDQSLEELEGLGLYNNSIQYYEPYRTWLVSFIKNYGLYLSTEESWNDDYYKEALKDKSFNLDGDLYEDSSNWHSFNDFFSRYLSSSDKRPIDSIDDNSILVSPADSVPQGIWRIDANNNLLGNQYISVKSGKFSSVSVLLGDSEYKDSFKNGTMTHTFLDVNDYHRYHMPISGTIKEVNIIYEDDAIGGVTVWDKTQNRYLLECSEPGWQMIETRGYVIVETEEYGLVAVMPIGMSQVSSVNFEENIKVGAKVNKGDMLGYFLFGGSDIIMLFQEGVDVELTMDYNSDGTYNHINMGNSYAKLTKK